MSDLKQNHMYTNHSIKLTVVALFSLSNMLQYSWYCFFSFFFFLLWMQVPVPALKEQIATVTGVLSEQQRLICRGKVLKDDQLLSAYRILLVIDSSSRVPLLVSNPRIPGLQFRYLNSFIDLRNRCRRWTHFAFGCEATFIRKHPWSSRFVMVWAVLCFIWK